jgi:outer membrane lipoprotein-sorting protein
MRSAEQIEKILSRFYSAKKTSAKTNAEIDKAIIAEAVAEYEQVNQKQSAIKLNRWSIIMKKPISKMAVAAVFVIAAALSIMFVDKAATPAYALEQTIEAMRYVNSIHAYSTDWDGSQGQAWIKMNPETGKEECYHADQGNLLIIAKPHTTYYYHRDKNLVRIIEKYVPASSVSFSRIFEELPKWVQEHGGKYEFKNKFDKKLQMEIIEIHVDLPSLEKEFRIYVDPQTKLPITLEAIRCKPGQGVKSIDSIEYNVLIPDGIFEFEPPEGAEVKYE